MQRDGGSDGNAQVFEGVGALRRGDLLSVVYAADASLSRSRWLFGQAEAVAMQRGSVAVLLFIPQSSKPPDQEVRAFEAATYVRLGKRIRRIVAVPEGSLMHTSVVRLVLSAYITLSGKGSFFFFARGIEHALELVGAVKTPLTPDRNQILADLALLRAAL
jgi:hypothetical protein